MQQIEPELDAALDRFRRQWTAHELAETLTRMMDMVEQLHGKINRLESAALASAPRNEYGLTDFERIVTWRMLRVGLGEDPKNLVHKFPPEDREPMEPEPLQKGVLDE